MSKVFLSFAGLLLVVVTVVSTVYAAAPVSFTWTVTDLGQGCHGGGPLYADGRAGGYVFCSFDNGQTVFQVQPVSWSLSDAGVTFVLDIVAMKGIPPYPSPYTFGPVPVTGTPVKLILPGYTATTQIRVTPVN